MIGALLLFFLALLVYLLYALATAPEGCIYCGGLAGQCYCKERRGGQ